MLQISTLERGIGSRSTSDASSGTDNNNFKWGMFGAKLGQGRNGGVKAYPVLGRKSLFI